jgi:hypothetical protein
MGPGSGGLAARWRDRMSSALRTLTNGGTSARPGRAAATPLPSQAPGAKPGSPGAAAAATSLDEVLREAAGNRAARPDADGRDGPEA